MAKFDEKDAKHPAATEAERSPYHIAFWSAFSSEAATSEHERFFRAFAPGAPALAGFADADELIAFLRCERAEDYDRKDAICLALIAEQQSRPTAALFSLLIRAMTSALIGVFGGRARGLFGVEDRDELCARVIAAFAETIAEYPLDAWPRGVAKNLKLNTVTRLRAGEAAALREQESIEKQAQAAAALVSEQECGNSSEPIGLWDEQMVAEERSSDPHPAELAELRARLKGYVREGYLAPRDVRLLFETCSLGRSVPEVAAELGISVSAAYKRKQRALDDIRDRVVRRRGKS